MTRVFLTVLFVGFFFPLLSYGAIAIQATSSGGTGFATSKGVAITPGAGSDIMGVVGITVGGGDSLTGVTWGGTSIMGNMVAKVQLHTANNYSYMLIYPNPPTSTQNVTATISAANNIQLVIHTYTGVSSSSVVNASATNKLANTSISQAVTTTVDNAWLVSVNTSYTGTNMAAGANTTLRSKDETAVPIGMGDSNAPQTPAGNYSQAYSDSGNGQFHSIIVAALAPVAEAPPATPTSVDRSVIITITAIVEKLKLALNSFVSLVT